jgi:hypothetical protein
LKQRHTAGRIAWSYTSAFQRIWGRVMTVNILLSREQTTAIKDHFAAVEITDADFNRTEVIGDLISHIEIVDTRQDATKLGQP